MQTAPKVIARWALVALAAGAIFLATLHDSGRTIDQTWSWSLIGGSSAIAELLQNLILFVPLGIGLALTPPLSGQVLPVTAIGALLSFSVEFAQQWIGGRDPSVGDIVANTCSTAIGASLVRFAPHWLTVSPERSARHALAAALLAILVWFASAAALRPAFGPSPYQIVTRPDFEDWGRFRGDVLEATMRGGILYVKATFPDRTPRHPSPLAAVLDANGRQATILAIVERDLTLSYDMPSAKLTLKQPDLRWDHVLDNIAPGDTFTAMTGHEEGKLCLAFNTTWRCDVGYTIGDGWKLIFYPEHWPGWRLAIINACWVMGCVVFVGFWAGRTSLNDSGAGRRRAAKVAVAIVLLGMILVPMTTHLKGSPLVEWIGALLGIELGLVLGNRSSARQDEHLQSRSG